jgi:hypothetical protein
MEDHLRPPRGAPTVAFTAASNSGKNPDLKLWLLFGMVVIALLMVLLVLPSLVEEPALSQPAPVVEPEKKAIPEKLQNADLIDQFRSDAEHALQDFLRIQAQPGLRNAEVWAGEGWQMSMDTAARGDTEFGQGEFASALKAYQDAGTQLQTILDERERTLQTNLDTGWQYLQDNAVEEASAAFELVIAMQVDHQDAQLGLERAAVREQVLEFMISAQQAEVSNTLHLAAESYLSALQLDPLYAQAREALEKVEFELRNRAFQDSMGQVLQALDDGELLVAERALAKAATIRPGDPTVKEARQRLLAARRQASLGSLRKDAQELVRKEDWTAAAEKYRRALAIDSKAAFARNGLDQAEEKQQLHKQLDHYLSDTTRLFSDDPLDNARKLLAANQQTASSEPLLAEKLATLQQAVTLAVIPVDLLILSDNLTQVTIYKFGRLGSFEQKQLSLRPGKYTITGTRQGYRDVLKVVELKPGINNQSLTIRTEEQF